MTEKDIYFSPHNDMEIQDVPTYEEHENLISENKFSDATTLLNNGYDKGFRASLFNSIQNKIRIIQLYILNKTAEPDEFYSINEPSASQMGGKQFWIKPF